MKEIVLSKILWKYETNHANLLDILIDVQEKEGYVSEKAITEIANHLHLSEADVSQTLTFYHFLSEKPRGKYVIYLNNSSVSIMMGAAKVKAAFEQEVGCKFGEVSKDGKIGLFKTACIGMNDQEPAALINGKVFTRLTPFRVREIVKGLKNNQPLASLYVESFGDGKNQHPLVQAMVCNNIMRKGPVLADDYEVGNALRKCIENGEKWIIEEMKGANLRGRGGAGFPTGFKWEACRNIDSNEKYIFCNADEGEPGTFKDRVILTEKPDLLLEGMAIAARAVGATKGIIYLRFEYKYLQKYLEEIIKSQKKAGFLGKNILGIKGFDFEVRIQFGAGAYVCGEESALIESAEGKRGEPRERPPFPVEKGFLDKPTIVNNVETLCSAVKIIWKGAKWYKRLGTPDSTGTKVLSISGDCKYPGIYEIEWGFNVHRILEMAGADEDEVLAVQVGGPSGSCISRKDFNRTLDYIDLATGGSFIIIGKQRDLLKDVILNFTEFFEEESCGSCTPCRVGTLMLKNKLQQIIQGNGTSKDLDDLKNWAQPLKSCRCGLGQTAANPILTSLKNFPGLYQINLKKEEKNNAGFSLQEALREDRDMKMKFNKEKTGYQHAAK
ncbi:MAG: NAD(P)H-dependent oxidoreductase subunit E [Bacteroidota bacterium]